MTTPQEIRNMIQRVYAAVDYLMDLESQDRQYVIEMSQEMLNDILEMGELKSMSVYITRYCTVADTDEERQSIADDI